MKYKNIKFQTRKENGQVYGKAARYFRRRNYGFICGEDGNTYFTRRSNADGEYLEPGYYVYFKPFQNDGSGYNAKT